MKKFIFITNEGYTSAPNKHIEVNNSQVIGLVENVANEDDALKQLLKENTWIWESGFNVAEFKCYQIL